MKCFRVDLLAFAASLLTRALEENVRQRREIQRLTQENDRYFRVFSRFKDQLKELDDATKG